MKNKLLLLLLLATSSISIAQTTLANKLKITANTTSTTATKVNVQEADGTVNTMPIVGFENVIEVDNYAALPSAGLSLKLYVTKDTNKLYRWNGSTYVDVASTDISGKADLINGKVPLSQINDALLGAVNYQASYNASTNEPALPSAVGNKGKYWVVNIPGVQQGLNLKNGDFIISNGTKYEMVDNNNAVTAVNEKIGSVFLNTADVADTTDKRYQTDAQRANNNAISPIQQQFNATVKITGNQFGINGQKSFNDQITFAKAVFTPNAIGIGLQINPNNAATGISNINSGTNYSYYGSAQFADNMYLESKFGSKSNYIANITNNGTGYNYQGQNGGVNTYTVNKTGDIVGKSVTLTGQPTNNIMLSGGTTISQEEIKPKNTGIFYKGKDIYWFGDSYTSGTGASDSSKRFTTIVSNALGANEINKGIAGTTMQKRTPINYMASSNMVDRISEIPAKTSSIAMLVFSYGLNDMGQTASDYNTDNFKTDYQTVLNAAIAKGWNYSQILLIPAYYIGQTGYDRYAVITGNTAPTEVRHLSFIQATKEIAYENKALYFDIYQDQKKNDKSLLIADGIHPNDAGYAYIANDILQYLREDKIFVKNNSTWDLTNGFVQYLSNGNQLKNSLIYDSGSAIGIGTINPTGATLHVNSTTNNVTQKFTNSVTGSTASDGTNLSIGADSYFNFDNKENAGFTFSTNNIERFRVTETGLLDLSKNTATFDRVMKLGTTSLAVGSGSYIEFSSTSVDGYGARIGSIRSGSGALGDLIIQTGGNTQQTRLTVTDGGNVVINTTDVPSAILNIGSTNRGVLLPRMTTAQKNAIVSPAEGLQVYDLTLHALCFYNGTVWKTVSTL